MLNIRSTIIVLYVIPINKHTRAKQVVPCQKNRRLQTELGFHPKYDVKQSLLEQSPSNWFHLPVEFTITKKANQTNLCSFQLVYSIRQKSNSELHTPQYLLLNFL